MSYRGDNKLKPLLDEVISNKKGTGKWSDSTVETARKDSVKILESIIAEVGVEKCRTALEQQGFNSPSYDYLLKPLYQEALRRRHLYKQSSTK